MHIWSERRFFSTISHRGSRTMINIHILRRQFNYILYYKSRMEFNELGKRVFQILKIEKRNTVSVK